MTKIMLIGSSAESLIGFRGTLLQEMVAQGHEVTACAPGAAPKTRTRLCQFGVRYRHVPLHRTGLNPREDLRSLLAFIRLMRAIQPDVVLSYTIKPTIYGSIAASIVRVGKISSMITGLGYAFSNQSLKQRIIGQLATLLYRVGLRGNKVVFFQNPDDMRLFRSLRIVEDRNHPVLIAGSGIDLKQFPLCPPPDRISFLLIARLIKEKGIREYAEAARVLKARYPEVAFCLVGGIDTNPSALTQGEIEAWTNQGVIEYLGRLEDVRPAIAASSVFVLPSYYREGVPHTILEAMSMGRPVITTDTPGCRETVVDGDNGFLVPVRDVAALVAGMERFILDPSLVVRMGRRSRLRAESRFDVHEVNHVILESLQLIRRAGA